jgi:hypothetical protein
MGLETKTLTDFRDVSPFTISLPKGYNKYKTIVITINLKTDMESSRVNTYFMCNMSGYISSVLRDTRA